MNISPSATAYQGIQAGFKALTDNTQILTGQQSIQPPDNTLDSKPSTLLTLSAPVSSTNELGKMLLDNRGISNTIQSLAKVIETEDKLIGRLLDSWA